MKLIVPFTHNIGVKIIPLYIQLPAISLFFMGTYFVQISITTISKKIPQFTDRHTKPVKLNLQNLDLWKNEIFSIPLITCVNAPECCVRCNICNYLCRGISSVSAICSIQCLQIIIPWGPPKPRNAVLEGPPKPRNAVLEAIFVITCVGEMSSVSATCSIQCLQIIIPCGPPKPRNAVLKAIFVITCAGEMSSVSAICSIQCSQIIIPWGPPKPRKAVLEAMFVLHRCPETLTFGIL